MAATKSKTTKKAPAKKKAAAKKTPSLHDMKQAIWEPLDKAGKAVASMKNDARTLVQEAAAEVNAAVLRFSQGKINESDLRKIVESWTQANKSQRADHGKQTATGIVDALKEGAANALSVLFGWLS